MPRAARQCPGGYVYHVWNHAAGRLRLFKKEDDYLSFERVMCQAHGRSKQPVGGTFSGRCESEAAGRGSSEEVREKSYVRFSLSFLSKLR